MHVDWHDARGIQRLTEVPSPQPECAQEMGGTVMESAKAQRPYVILLAEDDPELRALMASSLRRAGFQVREAKDGLQLAESLDANVLYDMPLPDLIVTDMRMPGMSGLQVLGAVRRNRWTVPVVMVTAFGDSELHAAVKQLGGLILDKPVEMAVLTSTVRRALAG